MKFHFETFNCPSKAPQHFQHHSGIFFSGFLHKISDRCRGFHIFPHDSLLSRSLSKPFFARILRDKSLIFFFFGCRFKHKHTHVQQKSFRSIDVTMDTKTANHILITTVCATLAILANAAPASINHAEVSRNSFYRRCANEVNV
jgi:hypothetical protein